MSVPSLLYSLAENGCVLVAPPDGWIQPTREAAVAALRELDRIVRLELAFRAPDLQVPAALWAAATVYRSCQFLVYREVSAENVRNTLSRPCPRAPDPGVCYSVDLTFRYLPDILRLARGIAPDDPLNKHLVALARHWPLSSVGAGDLGPVDISAFWADRSLRQLYVDRVLSRRDRSRLRNEEVLEPMRAALGVYPELCEDFVSALQEENARGHC